MTSKQKFGTGQGAKVTTEKTPQEKKRSFRKAIGPGTSQSYLMSTVLDKENPEKRKHEALKLLKNDEQALVNIAVKSTDAKIAQLAVNLLGRIVETLDTDQAFALVGEKSTIKKHRNMAIDIAQENIISALEHLLKDSSRKVLGPGDYTACGEEISRWLNILAHIRDKAEYPDASDFARKCVDSLTKQTNDVADAALSNQSFIVSVALLESQKKSGIFSRLKNAVTKPLDFSNVFDA
jgi:hypothetical protein